MNQAGLVLLIAVLDGVGFTLVGVGIVLAHTETLEPQKALGICNVGGAILLLSVLAAHLLVLRKVGFVAAFLAGCVTVGAIAFAASQTPLFKLPWINDISTDVDLPPPLSMALPGRKPESPPLPPEFVPQIRKAYPDLKPILTVQAPADVLPKVAAAVKSLPGAAEVRVDEAAGLVHAVEITPLMRFRDDFTVRVRPEGSGSRIDVRSRSRVGKSDLGANAARIRRVLEAIQRAVS